MCIFTTYCSVLFVMLIARSSIVYCIFPALHLPVWLLFIAATPFLRTVARLVSLNVPVKIFFFLLHLHHQTFLCLCFSHFSEIDGYHHPHKFADISILCKDEYICIVIPDFFVVACVGTDNKSKCKLVSKSCSWAFFFFLEELLRVSKFESVV